MKLHSLIIIALIVLLCVPFASAVNVVLNVQGTISGTCSPVSSVSVQGYCPSEVGNASCSIANATAITNLGGSYGTALTYDNAIYPIGIDVFIEATNGSCSSTAEGSTILSSAVGGGLPVTVNAVMTNSFTLGTPADAGVMTNQTINFTWVNNIVTPNSTIQISDSVGFGNINATISNIVTPNVTFNTSLVDGTYYWRILTYIGSTLIQQSSVQSFILANDAPIITATSPLASAWITAASTELNITTNSISSCSYGTVALTSYNAKTPFTTTNAFNHSTTITLPLQGVNTIYVQCNGTNGKLMPTEIPIILKRDTQAPSAASASVSINAGALTSPSSIVTVSWAGFSDSASGIVGYYVNISNNELTSQGTYTTASSLVVPGLPEGNSDVYVWAIDVAGNIGLAASDSIIVDTQAPVLSGWSTSPLNINQFTLSDVTVYVSVTDATSLVGLPQLSYRIGSDGFSAPADMTLIGGSAYRFTVPNQANPNDWANRAGENLSYRVTATDTGGYVVSETRFMYVNDQFTAPIFEPISSKVGFQDANISIPLRASDVDGDSLVFTSTNGNVSFIAINITAATAYWQPGAADVGTNILFFTVTDGYFNVSQAVIVNVSDVNDAPILASIPDFSVYEYEEFTYTLNATDVDVGASLTYSTDSALFVVGSSSGAISFTPTASQRGSHEIKFSVSDGLGGSDSDSINLTVLYCGDAICSDTYEDTSSCNLDCEADDDSQGFVIESKTCLGDTLEIKAVELVPRTTCPTKGNIINGWESCETLPDTLINIEQDVEDIYVVIESLLTNEEGLASFKPEETGNYRIRYDSTDYDDNIVYFGVSRCFADTTVEIITEETDKESEPEVNLPFFEEPLTTEQIVKLSKASKIVYFALLPFLLILLSVAGVSTYYRYDKDKGNGNFSRDLDSILIKINLQIRKVSASIKSSQAYKDMIPFFKAMNVQLVAIKSIISKLIEPLIKIKNLNMPFYLNSLNASNEDKLLLQSIYDYYYKSKNSQNFAYALQRESLFPNTNLRMFALNAQKLGIPVTYLFSETTNKDELLQLHEHMKVHKSYPTLTDIKMDLLKGRAVVVSLHMNALNSAAPQKDFFAVLTGYNKEGFFMLDYSFSRTKKTFVPRATLEKAWVASKYLECAIIKK